MDAPERPEVLRERDHVQEHRGSPSVHTGPHEFRSNEQAPPR